MERHFETAAKMHRIVEVLGRESNLWIDTTVASSTGAPTGLEDIGAALGRVRGSDAVVLNPGQAERLAGQFGGPRQPGLVIRLDWTNVFRGKDHHTPCHEPVYCPIAMAQEALILGASVVIATLLLGFDETFEANNVRHVGVFARQASKENIPIAVDVRPLGSRVNNENLADTILLGTSMALELGADILVIPYPGKDALGTATSFVSVPIVLDIDRVSRRERKDLMRALSGTGIRGVLLREGIFASDAIEAEIEGIRAVQTDSAKDTR